MLRSWEQIKDNFNDGRCSCLDSFLEQTFKVSLFLTTVVVRMEENKPTGREKKRFIDERRVTNLQVACFFSLLENDIYSGEHCVERKRVRICRNKLNEIRRSKLSNEAFYMFHLFRMDQKFVAIVRERIAEFANDDCVSESVYRMKRQSMVSVTSAM